MRTTWTSFRFDIVMMRARRTVTDISLTPLVLHSILVTVIVTNATTRFHLHSREQQQDVVRRCLFLRRVCLLASF